MKNAELASKDRPIVLVYKRSSVLVVLHGGKELLRYTVVTGKNSVDKEREGDLATPEGHFYICYKNPNSKYHRFLGISYPNEEDAERGLLKNLIPRDEYEQIRNAICQSQRPPWNTALGGEVGLHGPSPNVTWTHGCIAMGVAEIHRLYDLLDLGDQVTIVP